MNGKIDWPPGSNQNPLGADNIDSIREQRNEMEKLINELQEQLKRESGSGVRREVKKGELLAAQEQLKRLKDVDRIPHYLKEEGVRSVSAYETFREDAIKREAAQYEMQEGRKRTRLPIDPNYLPAAVKTYYGEQARQLRAWLDDVPAEDKKNILTTALTLKDRMTVLSRAYERETTAWDIESGEPKNANLREAVRERQETIRGQLFEMKEIQRRFTGLMRETARKYGKEPDSQKAPRDILGINGARTPQNSQGTETASAQEVPAPAEPKAAPRDVLDTVRRQESTGGQGDSVAEGGGNLDRAEGTPADLNEEAAGASGNENAPAAATGAGDTPAPLPDAGPVRASDADRTAQVLSRLRAGSPVPNIPFTYGKSKDYPDQKINVTYGSKESRAQRGSPESISDAQKEQLVSNAASFSELYEIIDRIGDVQGSQRLYTAPQLKQTIESVRTGELLLDSVTRTHGLRDAVTRLLLNPGAPKPPEEAAVPAPEPAAAETQEASVAVMPVPLDVDALMASGDPAAIQREADRFYDEVNERLTLILPLQRDFNTLRGDIGYTARDLAEATSERKKNKLREQLRKEMNEFNAMGIMLLNQNVMREASKNGTDYEAVPVPGGAEAQVGEQEKSKGKRRKWWLLGGLAALLGTGYLASGDSDKDQVPGPKYENVDAARNAKENTPGVTNAAERAGEVARITFTEADVTKQHGAEEALQRLKESLGKTYAGKSENDIPDNVKIILKHHPHTLATSFGFYNKDTGESSLMYVDDAFTVDSHGILKFTSVDHPKGREVVLLGVAGKPPGTIAGLNRQFRPYHPHARRNVTMHPRAASPARHGNEQPQPPIIKPPLTAEGAPAQVDAAPAKAPPVSAPAPRAPEVVAVPGQPQPVGEPRQEAVAPPVSSVAPAKAPPVSVPAPRATEAAPASSQPQPVGEPRQETVAPPVSSEAPAKAPPVSAPAPRAPEVVAVPGQPQPVGETREETVASSAGDGIRSAPYWAENRTKDAYVLFDSSDTPFRQDLFDLMRRSGVGPEAKETLEHYVARAGAASGTEVVTPVIVEVPMEKVRAGAKKGKGRHPEAIPEHLYVAHGGDENARLILAREFIRRNAEDHPDVAVVIEHQGMKPKSKKPETRNLVMTTESVTEGVPLADLDPDMAVVYGDARANVIPTLSQLGIKKLPPITNDMPVLF